MDQDYSEEENGKPVFNYKKVQELKLNKLVHSLLAECRKNKLMFPMLITKQICEQTGLECSETTFFALLSAVADFTLSDVVTTIKEAKEVSKYRKDDVLQSLEVQKVLEQKDIFICQPKVITEMGISELKEAIMVDEE